jgi:hypothetical protein
MKKKRKNNTHPSLLCGMRHTQNNKTCIEIMQSMPHGSILQPGMPNDTLERRRPQNSMQKKQAAAGGEK